MKHTYRGYEIDCHREPSMGGDSYLYFSVYAIGNDDNLKPCLEDSFTSGSESAREYMVYLKRLVDDFYKQPEAYSDESWQPPKDGNNGGGDNGTRHQGPHADYH